MPEPVLYPVSPHFRYLRNFMSKAAAYVMPVACDEELADDSDEPPDELEKADMKSSSDQEFAKNSHYGNPTSKQSLLTQQLLASPTLNPSAPRRTFERGMSNCSVWSNGSGASTAELTSDTGLTSPSRANTPSPPPPEYLNRIAGILAGMGPTEHSNSKPAPLGNDDTSEILGKKRCITFACGGGGPSRRGSQDDVKKPESETVPPKKSSALTFMCTQRQESEKEHPPSKISFATAKKPESSVPINAISIGSPTKPLYSRSFYDSESAGDSWTYQPYDKSKLLCVDDVLRKEQRIRKLSQEVEAEALQEDDDEDDEDEDEDDTLIDSDNEDDDNDEDDGEDEDEGDDEDDYDDYSDNSGNETDNEEGFADGESDDDAFYDIHPPMVPPPRSPIFFSSPWQIRAPSPELPDSTDFVCGTFDEDKPLEDAYLSCLESRKRSKHKATPQDIDPSFPTSDSEDSDNDEDKPTRHSSPDTQNRGRTRRPQSPPPQHQQRPHTPPPNLSRRGSRALSPPPPKRKTTFHPGNTILRSRSLPRRGKSFKIHSAHASPTRTTKPMVIRRGAMDIVKGLEKKRERRKAKKDREALWKAGEGAEKMREVALEICGKGKTKPIWVISA